MTISVCPTATVAASADTVWSLLRDPARYGDWWRARTEDIQPPGLAAPGQVIRASAGALGWRVGITLTVLAVDDARRTLDLRTAFAFGLVIQNHIVCQPVEASRLSGKSARVQFG